VIGACQSWLFVIGAGCWVARVRLQADPPWHPRFTSTNLRCSIHNDRRMAVFDSGRNKPRVRLCCEAGASELVMKYNRFEELPVWKVATSLAVSIYAMTCGLDFKGHHSLRDQLERAAVSISNNIAEGFERGATQELITFLYIARGSAGEVRSMLCLLEQLPPFGHLKSQISNLKSQSEGIAGQLRGWVDSLQNSSIKGPRYLTDKSRQAENRAKDREEFLAELRQIQQQSKGRSIEQTEE